MLSGNLMSTAYTKHLTTSHTTDIAISIIQLITANLITEMPKSTALWVPMRATTPPVSITHTMSTTNTKTIMNCATSPTTLTTAHPTRTTKLPTTRAPMATTTALAHIRHQFTTNPSCTTMLPSITIDPYIKRLLLTTLSTLRQFTTHQLTTRLSTLLLLITPLNYIMMHLSMKWQHTTFTLPITSQRKTGMMNLHAMSQSTKNTVTATTTILTAAALDSFNENQQVTTKNTLSLCI